MPESKSDDTIKLTIEQFSKLKQLNFWSVRVAQDAEVIVQEQKLKIAQAQKDIRDYLYTLAETLPINPSFNYELDEDTNTLKKKS